MSLGIRNLTFSLPDKPFGSYIGELDSLTKKLKIVEASAGTKNDKFKKAYSVLYSRLKSNNDLALAIDDPIMVRVLSFILQSDVKDKIDFTENVFSKIDQLKPNPGSLLIQSMYQYYLLKYDHLSNPSCVADWIKSAMKKKGVFKSTHNHLLGKNGPKWIVDECIANNREFSNELKHLDLENYASGRFLTIAKSIYFVEQLKIIPVNEPHPLLNELQNREVYNARYDEHLLLGHKVLQILVNRAPDTGIDDSWLNLIMAIAGDPRVPKSHPNYQKWWSLIDASLNIKMQGWLSRLDLRLFLEALENYSYKPGNDGMKRMFPARKRFLEGLLDKNMITGTRLFLAHGFSSYLRHNYKKEHLPNFSNVSTGSISVIHIQLGKAQMIEGSHSCQLWVYKSLNTDAIVFDYTKKYATYASLTSGLSTRMYDENNKPLLVDSIRHHPPLNWQHDAIQALRVAGVNVSAKDVLVSDDYFKYKRKYGVG